jgi:hypothetical protein
LHATEPGIEPPVDDDRWRGVNEQLAFTIDEVQILASIIERVPSVLLSTRPMDGEPSVIDLFSGVAQRDAYFVKSLQTGDVPDVRDVEIVPSDETAREVLARIEAARSELIASVEAFVSRRGTSMELLAALYERVRVDTDTFRLIGLRLHSSPVTGG